MRTLYRVWSSALSDDQVARILLEARQQPSERASLFSSATELEGLRSASVCWLDKPWLRDLLSTYVASANRDDFSLKLNNIIETQVVTYTGARADHYGWHHDVNWGGDASHDRKLSVTVQLSDPATYEGGDLEFDDLTTNADFRSKGTVVVFPSVLRHRISPVTSGTRMALVGWFSGPRWS